MFVCFYEKQAKQSTSQPAKKLHTMQKSVRYLRKKTSK